jgi:hypothetical protein
MNNLEAWDVIRQKYDISDPMWRNQVHLNLSAYFGAPLEKVYENNTIAYLNLSTYFGAPLEKVYENNAIAYFITNRDEFTYLINWDA